MTWNQGATQRFTVQDCTYRQGMTAVQMAGRFESWDDLRPELEEALPFNSVLTRRRYVSQLFRWAFDGGNLGAVGVEVWRAYRDGELVNHLLRERYLDVYPVLGKFVSTSMTALTPGTELDVGIVERHLVQEQVAALSRSTGKLMLSMRDMGFIHKVGGRYVVAKTSLPRTAFLLLLHYHLVPEPATITVAEIIEHPFWRYLGGRNDEEVRSALAYAAAGDALSRYSTVDSLEQITTRFSFEELLGRQVRLDS